MNYLHFDTAQREDLTTDSFSCELKLSNPLRNVKKIYLKSVEMPIGFFNIRQTQYFEYVSSPINYENINPKTLRLFAYNPKIENNYNTNEDSNSFYTYTLHTSAPGVGTQQQQNAYRISIAIVPGNYTITTLLSYINEKLNKLFVIQETNFKAIEEFPFTPQFELTTVDSSDSSIFPIGYVRASFTSVYVWITQTEFNYKYLGFTFYRNNFQRIQSNVVSNLGYIDGLRPWNIHQDLCLYLYFENIPQTNTHFRNILASFKIPIKSGYQAIEYNAENVNFAQYIENTDGNYILDTIKLKVYDRNNKIIINNGFDFKFTLAVETGNI
jgi:hypothetical protein